MFIAPADCSEDFGQHLVEKLTEARESTRRLLSAVSDVDLFKQHDPIMSPLIWAYGHIGNYEELWLLKHAFGAHRDVAAFESHARSLPDRRGAQDTLEGWRMHADRDQR